MDAEVRGREPQGCEGTVADQDADLPGPHPAPQRQVERHGLEAQPRRDLGGRDPFGRGRFGREDQRRAEAVGHAVAVLVKEEMAEIEQGGEVEGGWGGWGGLGGGGVGGGQQRGEGNEGGQGDERGPGCPGDAGIHGMACLLGAEGAAVYRVEELKDVSTGPRRNCVHYHDALV